MSAAPCLLCVHAHPDDESLFTAGVMARYAAAGVRSVLVTCTDGSLGIPPAGTRIDLDAEERRRLVAAARAVELEQACAVLGVDRLERLGYRDSGMVGWAENDLPDAFIHQPLEEVTARIRAVVAEERPQVVITYDARGFYGHPDHIRTHQATLAAIHGDEHVQKLYFPVIPETLLQGYLELAKAMGLQLPEWLQAPDWGTPDELVTTVVDCREHVAKKHAALAAHASQGDNADLVGLPADLFAEVFGTERYVRALDRTGAPVPEDDLFAGVR